MNTKTSLFLAAAIAGFGATAASHVAAYTIRQHSSACKGSDGYPPQAASSDHWTLIYCPVPDSDALLPRDMSEINVHGRDESSEQSVHVYSCEKNWDDSGGRCRYHGSSDVLGTGEYAIQIGSDAIFSEDESYGDFKYIQIGLPPRLADQQPSTVYGVFYGG